VCRSFSIIPILVITGRLAKRNTPRNRSNQFRIEECAVLQQLSIHRKSKECVGPLEGAVE
jgi:hypothetical protein